MQRIESRSRSRLRKRAWLLVALAAVSLGGFFWLRVGGRQLPASAAIVAPQAVVPVGAAKARRADFPIYLWGLGNVQAYNTVTIRAQVDGQIIDVAFKEGQEVRAGDLLLRIDPRSYQANVDQAVARKAQDEAQLENARRDLERSTKLIEKSHVSRQALDATEARVAQYEAAVKADEAAIAFANVNLDHTRIRSPLDGRVGMRLVDVGNIVRANDNTNLVTITQTRPVNVVFTLPETALPQILKASGQKPLTVAVFGHDSKEQFDVGELSLIDNSVDQTTGTIRLKAAFPNTEGLLWPGQFINARLHLTTLEQALTIPANAVQSGPDGNFAYIVKADGAVAVRKLAVGATDNGVAVIESGLVDGDVVVTSGHYRLQPGTKVDVRERLAHSGAADPGQD